MDIIILDKIAFNAPLGMFAERMRLQKRPALLREVEELLAEAKRIARPRVMFGEAAVESLGENDVQIGGRTFHSSALRQTLAGRTRVFPAVATCGTELAAWAEEKTGMFTRFSAEAICEAAMAAAQAAMAEYVAAQWGAARITYILPGTLDWPLEEQEKIFALLEGGEAIGVQLTPQGTMRPVKTVSALYYETD
ncbi:MAG TPA: hypothetical protein GX699_01955 [Firmicutes bacterium]|nr:hypothetical protein [Bacillota bacterium]